MAEFIAGFLITLTSFVFGAAVTIAIRSTPKEEVAKKNVKGKTLSS